MNKYKIFGLVCLFIFIILLIINGIIYGTQSFEKEGKCYDKNSNEIIGEHCLVKSISDEYELFYILTMPLSIVFLLLAMGYILKGVVEE